MNTKKHPAFPNKIALNEKGRVTETGGTVPQLACEIGSSVHCIYKRLYQLILASFSK